MKKMNLPDRWIERLTALKRVTVTGFRHVLLRLGLNVIRSNDYYSPLPNVAELKAHQHRWNQPSRLAGLRYDLDAFKRTFELLLDQYLDEFLQFPPYEQVTRQHFGPGYSAVDALTLYLFLRHYKPQRYIEIGSGISTYYCSLAAQKNALEGYPLRIICIEPFPYDDLRKIAGIEIRACEVQEIELSFFEQLQENDILFIDSSHALKIDSDVQVLYLEVLPHLKPGVLIHIHDIPWPYNIPYPAEFWIFRKAWPKFWNEAMLVQAFLAFNPQYEMLLSTPLLRYHDEAFLQQRIPFYQSVAQNPNTFSSLWLHRLP